MVTFFILSALLLTDYGFFHLLKQTSKSYSLAMRHSILRTHLWISASSLIILIIYRIFLGGEFVPILFRQGLALLLLVLYFTKFSTLLIWLCKEVWICLRRTLRKSLVSSTIDDSAIKISRSRFLTSTAGITGAVSLATGVYGISRGLYDYQMKRVRIHLPDLPKSFDGIRIGQISDIHAGSLLNKTAVQGGLEMLMHEKPEIIFFTGDMVNYATPEVYPLIPLLQKVKAPLGTFSSLGNHDYGDYRYWSSEEAKAKNLRDLIRAHQVIGWEVLIDEHRFLTESGEKIAILGVGNWGTRSTLPKYGKLAQAHQGTDEASVKLLLSHDPSHWDAQIRPTCPDIDVTFAGHTHGMQIGIDWGNFRWSPVQYLYEQWGGLYQKGRQYIYVNQGFGYSEMFPLRIGMPPEITIIELKRSVS
jgi:hypothetical protein